jgi:hypothetical protein
MLASQFNSGKKWRRLTARCGILRGLWGNAVYDKQILADYFKGKRGKDAEVRRQFELLRRQAEIDCRDLRELGDMRVTPESIEEDYIYNAQLIAKTQGMNEPTGSPTAKSVLRVVFLSMIGPIILSAVGPIYYGYTNGPYWRVIVCRGHRPPSVIGRALLIVAIVIVIAGVLVIGDTLLYFLARALH